MDNHAAIQQSMQQQNASHTQIQPIWKENSQKERRKNQFEKNNMCKW